MRVFVINFAPQVTTLALTPDVPRTLDDLVASVEVYDADSDPVTVSYAWRRNGVDIPGQETATLPHTAQAKHDAITVVVTATDGFDNSTKESSVVIEDTPAALAAAAPTSVDHGDSITFQVTATAAGGACSRWRGPAPNTCRPGRIRSATEAALP